MPIPVLIDDDVMVDLEAFADKKHQPVGAVLSEIARKAIRTSTSGYVMDEDGFPVLIVKDSTPVTLELVNRLRDEAN